MPQILLVAGVGDADLKELEVALRGYPEVKIRRVTTRDGAMACLAAGWGEVVVVSEALADDPPLPLLKEITRSYPMCNCAMVSALDPALFHETTEGLGLFMQLPACPGPAEAAEMMALLARISTLIGGGGGERR